MVRVEATCSPGALMMLDGAVAGWSTGASADVDGSMKSK